LVKIDFKAIEYLEIMEDYVHLIDGKSIQTLTTLKKLYNNYQRYNLREYTVVIL